MVSKMTHKVRKLTTETAYTNSRLFFPPCTPAPLISVNKKRVTSAEYLLRFSETNRNQSSTAKTCLRYPGSLLSVTVVDVCLMSKAQPLSSPVRSIYIYIYVYIICLFSLSRAHASSCPLFLHLAPCFSLPCLFFSSVSLSHSLALCLIPAPCRTLSLSCLFFSSVFRDPLSLCRSLGKCDAGLTSSS